MECTHWEWLVIVADFSVQHAVEQSKLRVQRSGVPEARLVATEVALTGVTGT